MTKKFLSNTYNPKLPNAERYLTYSISAYQNGGDAMKQEWLYHLKWVKEHAIGSPQETEKYSVSELKNEGLVGIYSKKGWFKHNLARWNMLRISLFVTGAGFFLAKGFWVGVIFCFLLTLIAISLEHFQEPIS